jgi:hypothetical protein
MAKYVVTAPYRGERFFLVEAESKAEALRKAAEGEDEGNGVEMLDYRVTEYYKPNHARLEKEPTNG